MVATAPALSDYRILLAGCATITLSRGDVRYTYRVNRVDSEEAGRDPVYFVKYLTGADNETDYTYLGMLLPREGRLVATKASRALAGSQPFVGFQWLASKLLAGASASDLPNGVEARWSDRCQRCGRTLTVPSSIDARLGPDCAGKV